MNYLTNQSTNYLADQSTNYLADQSMNSSTGSENFEESIFGYTFEIIADIFLGLVLGIGINVFVDHIGELLHLSFLVKIIIQLMFIIVILYFLKIDSNQLYSSWKGHTSYGIIFTSVFIASQRNLIKLFDEVYKSLE
ncbi:hypothetical protein [Acanthamoeba polyphaga mimivirus]|uniref:Uncharacterized protein n=4 Tax=Megamimivirinae TaxID=3044648 RepID=A0A2L2DJZ3_MIMIV|nr:hypothetical protein MegaChil _gp0759 [Megavirus chiliensis]AFX92858.1 hypothetical protein CE11_00832 [Megavirus courdo11]AGD92706.1 hypothetical protein LBA_00788 [Megavirus lba]AVG46481.1 hypothetical protein [Acanthamoeba polyphaga mimivirus]AVL94073.1 hypothetical protein mvi_713 [Megavirus vitis]AEQ33047.1 hypothetical protein [Megavirus chiliensis]